MKMKLFLTGAVALMLLASCHTDCELCTVSQFNKLYGGTDYEGAYKVVATTDGGYIFVGWTLSNDMDVSGNHGREDVWVVKVNRNGNIQWQRTYGGTTSDVGDDIIAASDGGYIIAGQSYSNDGDVSGNHGGSDAWIIKIDVNGNLLWQKTYGGTSNDYANRITAGPDGGYVFSGGTESNDGDVSGAHGNSDAWVVKIDHLGNMVWEKPLGGSEFDLGYQVTTAAGGGYLMVGSTTSTDGGIALNRGRDDAWAVKLDESGNKVWEKTYGGSQTDLFTAVINTTDNGFLLTGITASDDGDVVGKLGGTITAAAWVVKISAAGTLTWQTPVSAADADYQGRGLAKTTTNGYALVGSVRATGESGNDQGLLVKLDGSGNILNQHNYGGSAGESFFSIIPSGNCFVISGGSTSNDGDLSGNHGAQDAWVIKTQ